jgi:hypothetical protein
MRDSESFIGRGDQNLTPSRDAAIARLAAKQFGVISLEQLLAIGLTYEEIRGRVKRGLLHELHPGVFAVGHRRLVPHARLIAALLTCGPASFLSHRTAAAVWGLRALTTKQIHVTMPGAKARTRTGLVTHRTSSGLYQADLAVRNGLRVSSVPRMLIELARSERPSELDRLITQATRPPRRRTRRPSLPHRRQRCREGQAQGHQAPTQADQRAPDHRPAPQPGPPRGARGPKEPYLSSAEVFPSSSRATTRSWICWVPSNRSRILASRAHFSRSSPSA